MGFVLAVGSWAACVPTLPVSGAAVVPGTTIKGLVCVQELSRLAQDGEGAGTEPTQRHPGLSGTRGDRGHQSVQPQHPGVTLSRDRSDHSRDAELGTPVRGQREVGLDRDCCRNTLTNGGFSTHSSPPPSEDAGLCPPLALSLICVTSGGVTAAFGVALTQLETPPELPLCVLPPYPELFSTPTSGTDVCCPPLATLSGHK